jgi:hypothetical protein
MKRNMEERTASKVSLSNDSLRIVTYMVNMWVSINKSEIMQELKRNKNEVYSPTVKAIRLPLIKISCMSPKTLYLNVNPFLLI